MQDNNNSNSKLAVKKLKKEDPSQSLELDLVRDRGQDLEAEPDHVQDRARDPVQKPAGTVLGEELVSMEITT